MKNWLKILSAALVVMLAAFTAIACGEPEAEESEPLDYEIGFVIAGSTVEELPIENDIWQALIEFGESNGNSHRYYTAETHDQVDYLNCVKSAVSNGVKVIVTQGHEMAPVVRIAQKKYPDVDFIHIQGAMNSRNEGKGDLDPASNTLKISFCEEQAGFLAGYGCVKNKNWKLSIIGNSSNTASKNYAAGFLQGAEAAAEEMGVSDVTVKCRMYRNGQYREKIRRLASRLYRNDTEVIFVCDSRYYAPVAEAAENNDGEFICSESDKSAEYENVLTSAARDYNGALNYALTKHFDNKFPGGKTMRMGALRDSVMLPMDESEFDDFSEQAYEKIYKRLSSGSVKVKKAPSDLSELDLEIVSLQMI